MDYQSLLDQVRQLEPYINWKSSGKDKYRDYSSDENPSLELSVFGLFCYKEQKVVKSLTKLAIELGILTPTSNIAPVDKDAWKNAAIDKDRLALQEKINKQFSGDAPSEAWRKKCLPILWGYFVIERNIWPEVTVRKCSGEAGMTTEQRRKDWMKEFAAEMWRIKAHVIQYTLSNRGEPGMEGEKVVEIRIPMLGLSGELVQVMRIGVAKRKNRKEQEGKQLEQQEIAWRKTFKRYKFNAEKPRAICIGNQLANEAVMVEGIEDALTLWACARFIGGENAGKLKGVKYVGKEKLFVVSGGTSRIDSSYLFASGNLDGLGSTDRSGAGSGVSDSGGSVVHRLVDVQCDNNEKDEGLIATHVLGHKVQRWLPRLVGWDANRVWSEAQDYSRATASHEVGMAALDARHSSARSAALKHWLYSQQLVSWEEIEEERKRIEASDINLAKVDVLGYAREKRPWTNASAVKLFLEHWGEVVRRAEDGNWWVFTGKKWEIDIEGARVLNMIYALQPVFDKISKEIEKLEQQKDHPKAVKCRKAGDALLEIIGAEKILRALKGALELRCRVDDFDARGDVLNVLNGVLLLGGVGESVQFVEHSPEYMCAKIAEVQWAVDDGSPGSADRAKCPVWEAFLSDIMCGDEELLMYKQRQIGYCLGTDTNEKAVFYHYGPSGNNGKSTETAVLVAMLGEYAKTVSPNLITEQRFGGGNEQLYEMAGLKGIRLAICSEIDERKVWSEAAIKRITGDSDEISARFPYGRPFAFKPISKLMIHANNLPQLTAADSAFMRRLHLIPYNMKKKDHELDKGMLSKLLAEKSGILRFMVDGYKAWQKMGLCPPQKILDETESYGDEFGEDVDEFILECCEFRPTDDGEGIHFVDENGEEIYEKTSKLYSAYKKFCKAEMIRPKTLTTFGRALSMRGFQKERRKESGVKFTCRIGIRLNPFHSEESDDDLPF